MTDTGHPDHLSLLMKEVQQGQQQAYRDLFTEIGPMIVKVIRQRIRDENTVEDIYQTVLMTLHRARHTYDPERPFKPWLYSVVRNSVFDYLRKNRKKIELEMFIGEGQEFGAEEDTSVEEQQILARILAVLPDNQREAVRMLKLDGLTLEEAAERAGISIGAMKVRAHRGYETLKKILIKEMQESH